jgi:hypothetical protein
MLKFFEKDYSLGEWLRIATLQSVIGGTLLAICNAVWFGISQGNWLALALFPVTVVVTAATFLLAALVSHPIYQRLRTHVLSKQQ